MLVILQTVVKKVRIKGGLRINRVRINRIRPENYLHGALRLFCESFENMKKVESCERLNSSAKLLPGVIRADGVLAAIFFSFRVYIFIQKYSCLLLLKFKQFCFLIMIVVCKLFQSITSCDGPRVYNMN